ncbi:hypothetical protein J7I98_29390 [Streptomyces sp. ISL-98]|uniref:hypothetical protein n=1 Tax=Streptomyces sp. ISL-98 TaxID=2819192 RepID=UPI001BE5C5CD|nr:hypothetical protein [Streptomyces sp. ISL-98]MBT2509905.1 hypothetical protein [Streptomyces sp. ISL-98]
MSLVVLAMAAVNVSRIDRRVRGEVERRGLFLVSPDPEPGMPDHFVFVCTDPDPGDCGFTRVGQVSTATGVNHVVYVMDGRNRRQAVSLSQIRGHFPTWEDGIMAVLAAFDQWR